MSTLSSALRVSGAAIAYRLFDVGYQIDLDRAVRDLAASAPERVRPLRGEGQALQITNPPITVALGTDQLVVEAGRHDVELSARIFDFGVVSLRARVDGGADRSWAEFTAFCGACDAANAIPELLERQLAALFERIRPAIERPGVAPVREDYGIYRISALRGADGQPADPGVIRDTDVVPLLLREERPLSEQALRELLPHRFSYYTDDLAILTWEKALVVDPTPGETDIQYILEFANAQLLELRYYDAVLDAKLPEVYDRVEQARAGRRRIIRHRYAAVLGEMQTLVADSTELVERVENSIKVTDDVYLARIYTAAVELFRGPSWRNGIDRKLSIIRDTYAMLNAEAQSARAEVLELAVVLLIVAEIVLAFFH